MWKIYENIIFQKKNCNYARFFCHPTHEGIARKMWEFLLPLFSHFWHFKFNAMKMSSHVKFEFVSYSQMFKYIKEISFSETIYEIMKSFRSSGFENATMHESVVRLFYLNSWAFEWCFEWSENSPKSLVHFHYLGNICRLFLSHWPTSLTLESFPILWSFSCFNMSLMEALEVNKNIFCLLQHINDLLSH